MKALLSQNLFCRETESLHGRLKKGARNYPNTERRFRLLRFSFVPLLSLDRLRYSVVTITLRGKPVHAPRGRFRSGRTQVFPEFSLTIRQISGHKPYSGSTVRMSKSRQKSIKKEPCMTRFHESCRAKFHFCLSTAVLDEYGLSKNLQCCHAVSGKFGFHLFYFLAIQMLEGEIIPLVVCLPENQRGRRVVEDLVARLIWKVQGKAYQH